MKKTLKNIDFWLSEKYINVFKYEPFIQTILLHKIYPSRAEIIPLNGTISEGVDINQFELFVSYFASRGYLFIDENDIIAGKLDPNGRYIYLTFDDGYYNNYYALKVLEKYKAKATFYISTNHIIEGKSFWWDVQFRERVREGKSKEFITDEVKALYLLKWDEQEEYIVKEFGKDALNPINKIDRPMTEHELRLFAENEYVCLGNHTHNHLNTTIYSKKELIDSIKVAEKFIAGIYDKPVKSISYPYGFHNDMVIKIVEELEYNIGIGVHLGKNSITDILNKKGIFSLNRQQLSGFHDIKTQCHNINCQFSFISKIKSLVKKQ